MIAGLILAAGKSERMGEPKAFLPYSGGTFLSVLYSTLRASWLDVVRVVVGHGSGEIIFHTGYERERFVMNDNWEQGMLSSIQAGLRALEPLDPEAVMLFPVDNPTVSVELVNRIISEYRGSDKQIVVPVYEGKRGHPVLFARTVFPELMSASAEVGARAVVRKDPSRVLELPVKDSSVLVDIDTPEDYRGMSGQYENPSR